MMPGLHMALLDLLRELSGSGVRLIVGGGFGIYLRMVHVRRTGVRTLLREWPEMRSTNDLDLFLRPELLIDSYKLKPLSAALVSLGYTVVPEAAFYQFVKPGPGGGSAGSLKIDILTGPESSFHGTRVKVDNRRAKPRPSVDIHAHPTNEALTLEKGLQEMELSGVLSSGEQWDDTIFLPHPYTFLMMKLFAFRDLYGNENKDFGRYHALDLYTILATMTETEWNEALGYRNEFISEPYVREAGRMVGNFFSELNNPGMIRMRESDYSRSGMQLEDFMSAMRELFPLS